VVCTIVGRIHRDHGGNADSGHTTWHRVDGYRTVTEGSSLELVTMEQFAEGMKAAGALAAKFRPPGK
jgi:hypothetical protein